MKPLQLDVFGREPEKLKPAPAPYQRESETSHEAALSIAPKASGLRYEVLSVIVDAGEAGCTRKELEAATGIQTQTICPRLVELEEAGKIRKLTYFDAESRIIKIVRREGCSVYVVNRRSA